jgi:ring-1,2-phenylacetyl-CoA epoxidase subunit PaaD
MHSGEWSVEWIHSWLSAVKDPEIPVLNIHDLGVLRSIEMLDAETVRITITPTYSGCPAMNTIANDVRRLLKSKGIPKVEVLESLQPPWTTDCLSPEAHVKLEAFGIAPPQTGSPDKTALFSAAVTVPCPQCKSRNTQLISQFGSTACKALYRCSDCHEPFDYFKCLR